MDRFAGLRPLRHRQFALIWTAALVSNVGTWMQTVAVGTLITERTGEAGQAGLVAAAGFLPVGLLSPVGGALADRVDRRRLLVLTTLGETGFASLLALLYASGHASTVAVDLCVFGGGCMAALGFPCYQAMLPDLVSHEDLLGAVSLSSAQFNLGRVIGPALAGVVIAFGSYSWAFGLNAASFGAVLAALVVVRVASPKTGAGEGLWHQIKVGARYALPGARLSDGDPPRVGHGPDRVTVHRPDPRHRGEGVPRRCRHDVGAGHRPGDRRGDRGARPRPAG